MNRVAIYEVLTRQEGCDTIHAIIIIHLYRQCIVDGCVGLFWCLVCVVD